jgi:predicted enzyme related to lactoylglutathione lyase
MSGQFMWFDITAAKPDEVREFYAALFDWTTAPETSAGPYRGWLVDGEQPWAGIVHTDDSLPGRWLPYVLVEDLDTAARRAVSLGAAVVRDRTDGPAGTSIIIADPGGAQVALFRPFTVQA